MDPSLDPNSTSALSPEEQDAIKKQQMYQMLAQGLQIGLPAIGTIGGAALGSVVPGLGTAVGATVGGTAGGVAGQLAGAGVQKFLTEPEQRKQLQAQLAAQAPIDREAMHQQALNELLGRWRRYL